MSQPVDLTADDRAFLTARSAARFNARYVGGVLLKR